jgi:hypothetical protein
MIKVFGAVIVMVRAPSSPDITFANHYTSSYYLFL